MVFGTIDYKSDNCVSVNTKVESKYLTIKEILDSFEISNVSLLKLLTMKFADVKNDIAFRKIFGNENRKETLISFLNAVLDFHGDLRITQVTILNPYQLPKLKGGKVTIIDVKATDQAGRTYIVEMQVADIDGFDKRVLYYSSKSYSDQIKRADFYRKLRPVIFVGILDFEHTQNKNYISRSQVRDIETGEQTIKDMEFTFIELPKFTKELAELKTLTEKWVYFLKKAESLEVVPENINDEGLISAYEEANIQTWTQDELDAYEYAFMREEDERARLDKAEMKGKIELVIEMYNDGLEVERIAKISKLTIEKVKQIVENQPRK